MRNIKPVIVVQVISTLTLIIFMAVALMIIDTFNTLNVEKHAEIEREIKSVQEDVDRITNMMKTINSTTISEKSEIDKLEVKLDQLLEHYNSSPY